MEGSDPFETGAPPVDEDPFAEAEGGGVATEPDPSTVPAEEPLPGEMADVGTGDPAEAEPPIVDREGKRVDGAAAAQEPAAAPEPATPPPAPEAAQEPQGGAEPAPGGKKAKTEERRYKLLYQTGPAAWGEAPLDDAPDGAVEVKDGEAWLMARNADHARRLAFVIFGKPDDGVIVVPVAASSWKPKRVRRRPPQPDREALEIS